MYNYPDLNRKVAVITGAAGFIAEKVITELAKNKVIIYGLDNDFKSLNNQINKIKLKSSLKEIYPIKCDLTKEAQVKNVIKLIIKKRKKIDILINNAATKTKNMKNFFKKFEDFRLSDWKEIMNVNLDSIFLISREVSKSMIKNKSGSIVSLASIQGVVGNDKRLYKGSKFKGMQMSSPAVYSTSKAGLIGLTKYLATYLGEHNIRANSISPGGIEGGQNKKFVNELKKIIPMKRMGSPKDLEEVVKFLLNDNSRYVTGQNILIDGGRTVI